MIYYTEYPTTEFKAKTDEDALKYTKAKVVYRESDTEDGLPFVMLRVTTGYTVTDPRIIK